MKLEFRRNFEYLAVVLSSMVVVNWYIKVVVGSIYLISYVNLNASIEYIELLITSSMMY